MDITKVFKLFFTVGVLAGAIAERGIASGLKQILGPYSASMSYLQFENTDTHPFHVVIDQHEIFACRIDKYYQQSKLSEQLYYVEVHDDPIANKNCSAPKNITAGSVLEIAAAGTSAKDNRKTLLINNYSVTQSDSVFFERDTVKILANDSKDFWFYRIYDSEGSAFSARVRISALLNNGACYSARFQAYPLDFSFYPGGEMFMSDSRMIKLLEIPAASGGTGSCESSIDINVSWDSSPDPHPFRKMVIFIEKIPGISEKPTMSLVE